MGKMLSQANKVMNYLENNPSITSMQAINLFGCTRLAAVIYLLKKRGVPIISVKKIGFTRDGYQTMYAEYSLDNETWSEILKKRRQSVSAN